MKNPGCRKCKYFKKGDFGWVYVYGCHHPAHSTVTYPFEYGKTIMPGDASIYNSQCECPRFERKLSLLEKIIKLLKR
jgi:hypothetical protein